MVVRNKDLEKKIAGERIEILYELAVAEAGKENGLSKRYIAILSKLSSHYKVTIPKRIKLAICKHCKDVIVSGINGNARTASSPKRIVYICGVCGKSNSLLY